MKVRVFHSSLVNQGNFTSLKSNPNFSTPSFGNEEKDVFIPSSASAAEESQKAISLKPAPYKKLAYFKPGFYEKYIRPSVETLEKFAADIEASKEGKSANIPDYIVIEDTTGKVGNELIQMTKDISNADFAEIKGKTPTSVIANLQVELEQAEKNFEKNGRRTILKFSNADNFLFKNAPEAQTELLREMLAKCSDKYHATLIFKSKNSFLLNENLLNEIGTGVKCTPHNTSPDVMKKYAEVILGGKKPQNPKKVVKNNAEEKVAQAKAEPEKTSQKPVVKDVLPEETKPVVKEAQPVVLQEEPVAFKYNEENPNIRDHISIRIKRYTNIAKHTEADYEKYLKPTLVSLRDFAFRIEDEKAGEKVEYPNCIMLEDPTDVVAKDFIKMTRDMADVNYVELKEPSPKIRTQMLGDVLEQAEEHFKKTGQRTLLYVENMDELIRMDVPFTQREYMKSLLCTLSNDFHTTLIFNTRNSGIIHEHIFAPHRIGLKCYPHNYPPSILAENCKQILEDAKTTKYIETVWGPSAEKKKVAAEAAGKTVKSTKTPQKAAAEPAQKPVVPKTAGVGVETPKKVDRNPFEPIKRPNRRSENKIAELIRHSAEEKAAKLSKIFKIGGAFVVLGATVLGIVKKDVVAKEFNDMKNEIKEEWRKLFNEDTINDTTAIDTPSEPKFDNLK